MKLLQIHPTYREYLILRGALKIDIAGNEAIAGLTHLESAEYVAIIEAVGVEAKLKIAVDPERFMALYERHSAALPNMPSIMNAWRTTIC